MSAFGFLMSLVGWANEILYWLFFYFLLDYVSADDLLWLFFWILLGISAFYKLIFFIMKVVDKDD